jgi:uncharacterized membrane protein HdeD (DUF308 family)
VSLVPTAAATTHPASATSSSRAGWLPVGLGALSIVAGVLVLVLPHTIAAVALVTGLFLLFDGASYFVSAFDRETRSPGTPAMIGVMCIAAGVLLVRHPGISVVAVALVVGLWLFASGAINLAAAVVYDRRLQSLALGAVQLVAGIVIVASPGIGILTLAILTGIALVLNGIALAAGGWLARIATHPAAGAAGAP